MFLYTFSALCWGYNMEIYHLTGDLQARWPLADLLTWLVSWWAWWHLHNPLVNLLSIMILLTHNWSLVYLLIWFIIFRQLHYETKIRSEVLDHNLLWYCKTCSVLLLYLPSNDYYYSSHLYLNYMIFNISIDYQLITWLGNYE